MKNYNRMGVVALLLSKSQAVEVEVEQKDFITNLSNNLSNLAMMSLNKKESSTSPQELEYV
jgi:hypothetical protein